VFLCFPDNISKTDVVRITKLDIMNPGNPFILGVKREKVKVAMFVLVFRLHAILTLLLHT